MKKSVLPVLLLAATFALGFAVKSATTEPTNNSASMKKVTGIGGVFFKCKDPKAMNTWYNTHLGIDAGQYGARERSDAVEHLR